MKIKNLLTTMALTAVFLIAGKVGWGQVITSWSYDALTVAPGTATVIVSDYGLQSGTANTYLDGSNGSSAWTSLASNPELTTFAGTTTNDPRATPTAGNALAIANNSANGKSLVFKFSMTGYMNPIISFATRGTSTGFSTHSWEWSTDNITYTAFGSNTANTTSTWQTKTIDMSSIDGVDNATDVYIKLTVSGATSATGNNRIDNLVVNATELDVTAPTWTATYPNASNILDISADLTVNTDEIGTAYYVVLPNGATAPTSAQVVAGTDASDVDVTLKGNISIAAATTDYTANITGLSPVTSYDIYVVAKDAANNLQTDPTLIDITTVADAAAPVWTASYPTTANIVNTQFDLLFNLDEAGTVYYVVLQDGKTAPSIAQIKAFTDGDGVAAYKFGTQIIAAGSTEYIKTISGMADGATYDVYMVAEDDEATPNVQASVTSIADIALPALKAEPSNDVTGLATGTVTQNSIAISWTEDAAGPVLPDGYIVQVGTSAFGGDPTDGTPITEDTDLSDGGAVYVATGSTSYTLTGLSSATTYYIRVISYSNYDANINYKTGAIPSVSVSTPMLTLLTPNGGGTYYAGDEVNITWSSAFIDAAETIVIEVAPDGTSYFTIATSTNDGTQTITIPSDAEYAATYKVRVSYGTAASDESDAAFTVIATPSINAIQSDNTAGASNFAGDKVRIRGIVTAVSTSASPKNIYLQSGSGAWNGVYVYYNTTHTFVLGDSVTVEGTVAEYNGLTEISPVTSVVLETSGNTVPIPAAITTLVAGSTEDYEGVLVKVTKAKCTAVSSGTYSLDDGSGVLKAYKSLYDPALVVDRYYDVTGVMTWYNSGSIYEQYPRSADDIYLYSNVATLSDLQIDGTTVTGFDAATLTYNVELPYGTTTVPTVTYTETDTKSADILTNAASLPGNTTVALTSEDGLVNNTYTINFTVAAASTDATLSAIAINGTSLTVADCEVTAPTEAGATMWFDSFVSAAGIVPTKNDATATVEVKVNDVVIADPAAKELTDDNVILVTVTAQDGTTVKYYKVTLQQKPIITATANANGAITPNGSVIVNYDGTQAFLVEGNTGYHISALSVDATSVDAALNQTSYTYTFNNVVADHTIEASFALTTYTVTFNVTDGTSPIDGASITLTGYGAQTTNASGIATFTNVTPATIGYTVVKTGYNTINSNVNVANSDKSIDVTMISSAATTYTVTFNVKEGATAIENATVSLTGYGEQTTNASGVATFTGVGIANGIAYAVTKTEYVNANGTIDVVDANVDESVSMTKKTFTITTSADANGTITPSGDATVTYGEGQSYDVTAATGYHIASLLVDGNAVTAAVNQANYTYAFTNVTANHTIAATFAINTYTISVTAGANGTTTPNTNQTVNYGGSVSFTVAADANYHIKDVLVDGTSAGAIASYDFTNVIANHTFETQFEIDSYTITTNVTPAGAGTVSGAGDYNHGATVTLTATANTGYSFKEWQVNSVAVETNATYTFTASSNATIDAVFEEVTESGIYEGFNYSAGSILQTQTGWTAINTGDDLTIAEGSLSYTGLKAPTGNKVAFAGAGIDAYYSFDTIKTGTAYASFIFKVTDQSLVTDLTDGGYFAALADTLTSYDARIWVRPNPSATGSTFDIGFGSASSNPPTTTTTYNVGDAIFVVMSYNLDNGQVSVWINPSSTSFEGTEPTATLTNTDDTPAASISKFFLRQDSEGETPAMEFDELRIGTSWAEVTPKAGTTPETSVSVTSLADFGNIVQNTVGAIESSFSVSGYNLTNDIVVTAPAGFDISTVSGTGFTNTNPINLTPANGVVNATSIYVKFHPTAVQAYSGNITISSTGVTTDKTVAVTGTGIASDTEAPVFATDYPKSANIGVNKFDVVININEPGKVWFLTLASGATTPTVSEVKTGTLITVATANTDYSSTITDLTSNTTYDVYFVTEDNQATPNTLATPVKLTVTTTSIPATTIYDIQYTTDASGNSPYKDMSVTTSGIVTAVKMGTSAQQGFYIQDGSGAWNGLYVYSATPVVAEGDNVTLTGTIAEYNGLTEMTTVTSNTINSSNNALPAAAEISTLDANTEQYESVLIKVSNANCASGATGNFVVNDGTGNLTVYKGLYADLILAQGTNYDITGVMTWYNSASLYELYPRRASDVEVHTTKYTVTFNVTHSSTAIEGVTLSVNSQTLTTNASGVATIDLADGTYEFTATKDGYNSYSSSFSVAGATKSVDVVMYLTGVETNTIASLKAFPNPFSNEIRFDGADINRVTITSIIGQVVMDRTVAGENHINTQELVRGIYLVKFTNNKGESTLRKLIKE